MLDTSHIQYIQHTDGTKLAVLPADELQALLQNQAHEVPFEVQQEMLKRTQEMRNGKAETLTFEQLESNLSAFKEQYKASKKR